MRKAIKTERRYYMFMDYCNGVDLKELMTIKKYKVPPEVIRIILS